jgi:eukaryotic-like serine/threonine-protein kinase
MPSSSWNQLQVLFDELAAMPLPDRVRRLDQIGRDDPAMRTELEGLLQAHDTAAGPLDAPPVFHLTGPDARESSSPFSPGTRIGSYQLLRLLGEGGMGSVWLAERIDGMLKRTVALKLPKWTWMLRDVSTRLARERDILASLEHAAIARLYDAGVDELGRPYLAMEYIQGEPIDHYCNVRKLGVSERLKLVLQVARAVAYAHSRLIVHRDLKPGNILVGEDGTVRLLDFGIAKLLQSDDDSADMLTHAGSRMFTLNYAAPEQIKGEAIGTPTDVYSLGCVLYELVTAASPYRTALRSAASLEQAIVTGETVLASAACQDPAVARQLRGDLDAILNKALKRNPVDRYASVDAFADDVLRYLNHEPIVARPDGRWYRMRKFMRRHRTGLAAALMVSLSLVGATAVSLRQSAIAQREAQKATAIKDFLVSIFSEASGKQSQVAEAQNLRVIDVMDQGRTRLLGSLNDLPEAKLELIEVIGDIYELLDNTPEARRLYETALPIADATYPPNSAQHAHFLALIASAHMLAGEFESAGSAIERAAAVFAARGDRTSLDYARLLKLKGNHLRSRGQEAEAVEILTEATNLFATRYPNSRDQAGAFMFLAQAYRALNKPEQALQSADAAVAAMKVVSDDIVSQANVHSLRASVLESVGQFESALRDYEAASNDYRKVLGERHFLYLQNEGLRGVVLQNAGRRSEAMRLLTQSSKVIAEVRQGSNTHINALQRLGLALYRDGDFNRARELAQSGIDLGRERASPLLLATLSLDLARAELALGHVPRAREAAIAAVQVLRDRNALSVPVQAEQAVILADVALAQSDAVEAWRQLQVARSLSNGTGYADRVRRVRIAVLASRAADDRDAAWQEVESAWQQVQQLPQGGVAFLKMGVLEQRGRVACARADQVVADEAFKLEWNLRQSYQDPALGRARRPDHCQA